MTAPSFVHLRLHSEYSIVDSTLRIADAVKLAAADEQVALAITDLNNLFGFVKFYKAARAKGIKPVCGVDAWIEAVDPAHEPARLLFLAETHAGYLKLCDWLTRAFRENQHRGRALIRREWIADAAATEGVFCLSGGWYGEIGIALRNGQLATAQRAAAFWSQAFPNRFAMEIHRAGFENEHHLNEHSVRLATEAGLPVVATHPMQFATVEDYKAHEARVCIAEGYTLGDGRRPRQFTEQQRFLTQAEMVEKFEKITDVSYSVPVWEKQQVDRLAELEAALAELQDLVAGEDEFSDEVHQADKEADIDADGGIGDGELG